MANCSGCKEGCKRCKEGWYSRRNRTRDAQASARDAFVGRPQTRPQQSWDEAAHCWVKVGDS